MTNNGARNKWANKTYILMPIYYIETKYYRDQNIGRGGYL